METALIELLIREKNRSYPKEYYSTSPTRKTGKPGLGNRRCRRFYQCEDAFNNLRSA
jgi:hypothetical protein